MQNTTLVGAAPWRMGEANATGVSGSRKTFQTKVVGADKPRESRQVSKGWLQEWEDRQEQREEQRRQV